MRNLPSAMLLITTVILDIIYGWNWIYIALLALAGILLEWPPKESQELVKAQISELKAREENIKWQTEMSKTAIKLNLARIAAIENKL